ncbi:30S ribosomal protein S20 [Gluconacetobacter sp. SXCC-1]|nr:30S ribosomal protein S20 [Gluconacetobacter sp. SXCC-1]SAY48054.1 30S ribosomal protein S20 [Komagataeibacter rhaeticus]
MDVRNDRVADRRNLIYADELRAMANTASARKRIRQNEVRNARNTARMSRVRTFVKKVETAILAGKKDEAAVALREAQPELQRAVGKGVMHANTVARRISRLSARIKSLAAA